MLRHTLSYLEEIILEEFSKKIPRTLTELAKDLGLSDSSALIYHIRKLLKDGRLIKLRKGLYKTIENPLQGESSVPFFGKGKCGPGGFFLEDEPEYHVKVSPHLLKTTSKEVFALEASGDSMSQVICNGDIVFAKKTEILDPKSIYVVSQNGEVMIKKVILIDEKEGKGVLVSLNPEFEPIPIERDYFRIIGKVILTLRYL